MTHEITYRAHNPHALETELTEQAERTERTERLIDSFLVVKTSDVMRSFIQDILTEHEIRRCAHRLYAARMLSLGASYEFLSEKTGLSSATISKIAKQLKKRDGGYNQILARLYPNEFDRWDGTDPLLDQFIDQLK